MAKACFHFMRVILVIISLIFMLLGLAVVALAVFVKLAPALAELTQNQNNYFISVAIYILIGLGAFMAIFGFIGCFGACRKSTICLSIYITILLIIIIGEIGAGVFIVVQTQKISSMYDSVIQTFFDKPSNGFSGKIEESFKCCGANGPEDYGENIPTSCCRGFIKAGETPPKCTSGYLKAKEVVGCKKTTRNMVMQRGFSYIIGVILGIAGVEFIGIAFAIAICCHSRRQDAGYVSVVT